VEQGKDDDEKKAMMVAIVSSVLEMLRFMKGDGGRKAEHPTPNIQHPTSNGGADLAAESGIGCWMLGVEYWVFISFRGCGSW